MALIRGYHRRRGWLAWHVAALGRMDNFPELHEIDGSPEPPEETDEERAARTLANSQAWVIVTGGNAGQDTPEGESV